MDRKFHEIIPFIVAGFLGAIAGFVKVTWAFVYLSPISFFAFDLVIYSIFAFVISLVARDQNKLMEFVVFLLPSIVIVGKIAIDGLISSPSQNLPFEWFVTPFTMLFFSLIEYKFGSVIKANSGRNR